MLTDTNTTIEPDDPGDEPSIVAVTFYLPEAVQYIAHLRKAVRCMSLGLGISIPAADDLETVIGELATNAARHAKGGNYHVTIEFFASRVVVTVVDSGAGFDLDTLPLPGTLRLDEFGGDIPSRFGGFGLPLVHSIADRVHISANEPRGTIVRAEYALHPDKLEDP